MATLIAINARFYEISHQQQQLCVDNNVCLYEYVTHGL